MLTAELRRGDLVEVRSPAEILATLDARGVLGALPFMPEMAAYCGQRFLVERRADKICDTVKLTGSRRLPEAVFLADLRCDGSTHGGCQAECRLIWKEVWLKKISPDAPAPGPVPADELAALVDHVSRHLRQSVGTENGASECWTCQATELFKASDRLGTFDPRPYLREYTSGNVPLSRFLLIASRAAIEEPARKLGLSPTVFLSGPGGKTATDVPLDLQPGEYVQVKSKEEIAATLNPTGHNKGLWFDREMIAYCGGTFCVRQRVRRFIDDRNAQMVELKTDAVTLEGVACTGDRSQRRWLCPRHAIPYWRECWLRRIETPAVRRLLPHRAAQGGEMD